MKKTINQLIADCIDYALYMGTLIDKDDVKRLEKKSKRLRE